MKEVKEITEFLKKERHNPFRNFFVLGGKIRKASGLFFEFLKGNLSLKELILSLNKENKTDIFLLPGK
jgi:hypothetical protein